MKKIYGKNPARTKTARKSLGQSILKVYMNPFEVNKLYEEIKKDPPSINSCS